MLFVRQLLGYLVGDALHVLQLRRKLARLVEFRGGECGGEAGAEPRGLAAVLIAQLEEPRRGGPRLELLAQLPSPP